MIPSSFQWHCWTGAYANQFVARAEASANTGAPVIKTASENIQVRRIDVCMPPSYSPRSRCGRLQWGEPFRHDVMIRGTFEVERSSLCRNQFNIARNAEV
jgi:hypothetical protein